MWSLVRKKEQNDEMAVWRQMVNTYSKPKPLFCFHCQSDNGEKFSFKRFTKEERETLGSSAYIHTTVLLSQVVHENPLRHG